MKNGSTRSSKQKRGRERGQFGCETERVGDVSRIGGKHGLIPVGVGGENSDWGNTASSKKWESTSIDGGVIDQLTSEIEKTISHYKTQISQLEGRLDELRQLSGELKKINKHD